MERWQFAQARHVRLIEWKAFDLMPPTLLGQIFLGGFRQRQLSKPMLYRGLPHRHDTQVHLILRGADRVPNVGR